MRINPISINNYNFNKRKNLSVNNSNIIHFKSMPATPQDLLEMRMFARDVFENAQKSYDSGTKLIETAYEKLEIAKDLYVQALEYSDIFRKGFKEKDFNLSNGKTLEVISTYNRAHEIQPTCIKVYDRNKKNIQDIYFYNGFVNKIIEYLSPDKTRVTTFDGYNVEIIDDLDNKSRDIGAKYSFYQGELKEIKTCISSVPFASYTGNYYAYDKNKLFVNEQDTKSLFSGEYKVKHRYNFINGYLANYYKNFVIDAQKTYSWDESCHFSHNNILGKTTKSTQKTPQSQIVADNAIFLSGRSFITGKNIICDIGDNKTATFIE